MRTRKSWEAMVARCTNPKHPAYDRYRAVAIDSRWAANFEVFLAEMGLRPSGTSLERIDNAGGYGPDNCRWATPREQQRNMRSNHLVTIGDRTAPLVVWAEEAGIKYTTLKERLRRGWDPERALTTGVT